MSNIKRYNGSSWVSQPVDADTLGGKSYQDIMSKINEAAAGQGAQGAAEAHYIRIRENLANSDTKWRLVCVFPVNNNINKCSVTIDGKMGGWTSDNSYLIHAIIMNRDTAGYGTTSGPINATTDFSMLELYKNNSDNKAYLYVKVKGHASFDFVLRTSGEDANDANGISIRWNNSNWTTTRPVGSLAWYSPELQNIEALVNMAGSDSRISQLTDAVSTDTTGYQFSSYYIINNMKLEWGHVNSGSGSSSVKVSVNFPTAFAGKPIVFLQTYNKTGAPTEAESTTSQTQYRNAQSVRSVSSTGFTFDTGNAEAHGYSWMAIGRK